VEDVLVNTPLPPDTPDLSLHAVQATFLASVLPRIVTHGRIYFRHRRRADQEEAIQEMAALCWKWFLRLAERGKDSTRFPTALATFAARAVRCGRRLAGMDRSKDVLSPLAQQRRGFAVCKLPDCSTLDGSPLHEALHDNTQSPVVEQVCFRLDFPLWRASHTDRDRRVLDDLMLGERTLDVAGKYGLSPGRVSQLRRELHDDWELFCAEPPQAV
jgi:hypothetical protein